MMSYLAFSYMSLITGGRLELSTSGVAASGDAADRFLRKTCRSHAGLSLPSPSLICHTPFPVLLAAPLTRPG